MVLCTYPEHIVGGSMIPPLTEEEVLYIRGMIKRDKKEIEREKRQIQAEMDFDEAMSRDAEWGGM